MPNTKKKAIAPWRVDILSTHKKSSRKVRVKVTDQEARDRIERIEPVANLLATVAGRSLKETEVRLLERMPDRDIKAFSSLMHEIHNSTTSVSDRFGYGFFND